MDQPKEVPETPVKPEEITFSPEKVTEEGNAKEIQELQDKLKAIAEKGKNVPETCESCGQDIKDAEATKQALRTQYNELAEKLKSMHIIERVVTPSNINEFNQYQKDLSDYNTSISKIEQVNEFNTSLESKRKELEAKIKSFDLVEDKVIPAVV